MVRPPLFLDDSFSVDKSNTTLSSVSTESGEFIISQSLHSTTDIATDPSTHRNPYVEQYLNIYYKKSFDPAVIRFSSFFSPLSHVESSR